MTTVNLPAIPQTITTLEQYLTLARALVQLREQSRVVAEKKAELMRPVKQIQATAKEWFAAETTIKEAETEIRSLLEGYLERRLPESAAASAEAMIHEDIVSALEAMVLVPPVDGISFRNEIDFVVDDIDAVPEEFIEKTIRRGALKAALKAGPVPGITRKDRTAVTVTAPK